MGTNREPFQWKRCNQNSYDFFQVILHTFLHTSIQFLLGPVICSLYIACRVKVLRTFGFQDKDENEYEIWLPVFRENT